MKQLGIFSAICVLLVSVVGVSANQSVIFAERTLSDENTINDIANLEKDYYFIDVGGPTLPSMYERLNELLVIHGYIDPFIYIVRADGKSLHILHNENIVKRVWLYQNEKNHAALEGNEYTIIFFDDANIKEGKKLLEQLIKIKEQKEKRFYITVKDKQEVETIARIPGVMWIEPVSKYETVNDAINAALETDAIRSKFGLYGAGQIVSVIDTGLDTGVNDASMHDDIEGRILSIIDYATFFGSTSPDDRQGHGTHVTGTILGSGVKSGSDPAGNDYTGSFAGVAPKASLIFQAYGDNNPASNVIYLSGTGDITYAFTPAYNNGARTHSNSWTCVSCSGSPYTTGARELDEFVDINEDAVIVFAAGNFGSQGANSVKPPGTGKNLITVGASERTNIDTIASFSSLGPTDDGRIKPDLIAPGVDIISTKSSVGSGSCSAPYAGNSFYAKCSGTSMATPAIAGLAALVREYYQTKEGVQNPSAALVKATLINGAQDMGYGQISATSGFGRANIAESLPMNKKLFFAEHNGLLTGQSANYTVRVGDSQKPFIATLAYSDKMGAFGAQKDLISDLNLVITDPQGNKFNGNDLVAPFDDTTDDTNNVERARIDNPIPGIYKITVVAINNPLGFQDFGLVATYEDRQQLPFSTIVFNGAINRTL